MKKNAKKVKKNLVSSEKSCNFAIRKKVRKKPNL